MMEGYSVRSEAWPGEATAPDQRGGRHPPGQDWTYGVGTPSMSPYSST